MRLTKAVAAAVPDPAEPTAALAIAYARSIDHATRVPVALAGALDTLRAAADASDLADVDTALQRVESALAVATVLDKLGPKLLAALDALLLTPKAVRGVTGRIDQPAPDDGDLPSTLTLLRSNHDSRRSRAAG